MGTEKERYVLYEISGDRFLAWSASEMNIKTTEFAILPPYFDTKMANNNVYKIIGWKIDGLVKEGTVGGYDGGLRETLLY